MKDLSALELDALSEIFNISVGRSAAVLSELTGESVGMSVPMVHILSPERVVDLFGFSQEKLTCISQYFSGAFSGEAMLMFPERSSLEVVRLMLGSQVPLEQLSEIEQDALSEIGNIILNACFAAIADMLQGSFSCNLPEMRVAEIDQILAQSGQKQSVLFLQIQLSLEERNLEGYLAFLMGGESENMLQNALSSFLNGVS
ncbi:chemotaxis protein CheC [Oceanospirillum sediminis]|uniref:Chemotaxis protein CheC n=1 Tax=Oceanospirillum sediminis TaxID=2760088 RepID=A0A839IQZ4_9GAMM|nr:chemotaxis protein CheC [Oceanospirillum sediminis]MBB1486636.1 chemotaxis protein CheC [Oceanospirillum sediminis]